MLQAYSKFSLCMFCAYRCHIIHTSGTWYVENCTKCLQKRHTLTAFLFQDDGTWYKIKLWWLSGYYLYYSSFQYLQRLHQPLRVQLLIRQLLYPTVNYWSVCRGGELIFFLFSTGVIIEHWSHRLLVGSAGRWEEVDILNHVYTSSPTMKRLFSM